MSDCRFDQDLVERYASGACDDAEALAVERHLLECLSCESSLERMLAPAAAMVRAGLETELPNPEVRGRVLRPRRARVWWSTAGVAALAACLAVFAVLQRQPFPVTGVSGIVVADRDALVSGAKVGDNTLVRFFGPGEMRSGGLRIVSEGAYNEFKLVRSGDRWIVRDPAGPLSFVHAGESVRYGVALGESEFLPIGTRFRVSPERGRLEVYESEVVRSDHTGRVSCSAGGSLVRTVRSSVKDDPTAALVSPLPPNLPRSSPPWPDEQLWEQLEKVLRSSSPSRYWKGAGLLANRGRPDDALVCARLALANGSSPGGTADILIPALAANDDVQTATALLASASGNFLDPLWRSVVQDRPDAERRSALRRLIATQAPFGSLCAAEALLKATLDRTDPSPDKDRDLRAVAERLGKLAGSDLATLGVENRGRLWSALAEAQYFLGREQQSLWSLEKSVELWPLPSRVVHLCARRSEIGTPTEADRRQMLGAFAARPSYVGAERVLTFLRDTVRTEEDVERVYEFARWIGATYSAVRDAQFLAAKHLMYVSPKEALAFAEAGFRLASLEPDALRTADRGVLATLRWQALPRADRTRAKARQTAQECGLQARHGDSALASFYESAGLADEALAAIDGAGLTRFETAELKAEILARAGRASEAVAEWRTVGARLPRERWEHEDYRARVALAEAGSDSRRLHEVERHGWGDARRGWRRATTAADSLLARFLWVEGKKAEAVARLEAVLTRWHGLDAPGAVREKFQMWEPEWESDRRRLEAWKKAEQ